MTVGDRSVQFDLPGHLSLKMAVEQNIRVAELNGLAASPTVLRTGQRVRRTCCVESVLPRPNRLKRRARSQEREHSPRPSSWECDRYIPAHPNDHEIGDPVLPARSPHISTRSPIELHIRPRQSPMATLVRPRSDCWSVRKHTARS